MIKINLNPSKRKRKKKERKLDLYKFSNGIYILVAVFPFLLFTVYALYLNKELESLKEEKSVLLKERSKYKKIAQKVRTLDKEAQRLKSILEELEKVKLVYENLPKEKGLFLKIFSSLSYSLPDGVWINSIQISRRTSSFRGFAFKPEYISLFYRNLMSYYSQVKLSSIERESSKTNDYFKFRIVLSGFINKPKEEK